MGRLGQYVILLQVLNPTAWATNKAVFAHFMMANTVAYEISDWEQDISLAQKAHINAFALNMAYGTPGMERSTADAFKTAEDLGFMLFFSFDYAGNGSWPQDQIVDYLQKYAPSSAYYTYQGKTFVSTFEGTESADDWVNIKNKTDCFFVPDWSSVDPSSALKLGGGVVDGLFSWAAWPTNSEQMTTLVDASYLNALKKSGKPYMMPASPWFYTNMPGYNKNWAVQGDDLWYNRWVEISYLDPQWVEIISWNDYGESHYIGPLNSKGYGVFTSGKAPYNYARDMPHDGWRLQLPFVVDLYRTGTASMTQESLVAWYRTETGHSCSGGNTTGFSVSGLHVDIDNGNLLEDKIFFSALLASNASVSINIGGQEFDGQWEHEPYGGIGVYHGNFGLNASHIGNITIEVSRDDDKTVSLDGRSITATCTKGYANLNAWVGSATSGSTLPATSPQMTLSEQVCIKGSGSANFTELLQWVPPGRNQKPPRIRDILKMESKATLDYVPLRATMDTALRKPVIQPRAGHVMARAVSMPIQGQGLLLFFP
ncbi:uncharacterized protein N7484_004281 [Penicillium longicatenatum]|uniref:uncharacterized protein n=1 Tax=Penicillium longicatenatum TaxID=1561947 RepID=UPI0025465A52|nr:uncharacterized protein N7484_004281 [Penicillium longicatenatum]KAJ5650558.1 hypothetical protein N7484_004281 [Penicillium longicatenatum]